MIVIVRKYYAPILSLTCLSQATVAEKSSNAIDLLRSKSLYRNIFLINRR